MTTPSYSCTFCHNSFTTKTNFAAHTRIHTGEKPYKCDECGLAFRRKTDLTLHTQSHSDDRQYVCTVCSKSFKRKYHLTRHIKYHSDDRPYRCTHASECTHSFKTQEELTRHINSHTPSHKCCECGKLFSLAWNCRVHEHKHSISRDWKFVCPHNSYSVNTHDRCGGIKCDTRCKTLQALEYHIQASHTLDGLQKKLDSEGQLAGFFERSNTKFDRDFENIVSHSSCGGLKKYFSGIYSRPDFHLYEFQRRGVVVLVGNDEFSHRRYSCEFDRTLKISSAISACPDFFNVPVLYIRFNPHYYTVGETLYDPPLRERYIKLAKVLDTISDGTIVLKNTTGLNLLYMFYDTDSAGELVVFNKGCSDTDREFAMTLVNCVI
jgi:DNA-directed RNA polymerase subunit RPC12/RpoP